MSQIFAETQLRANANFVLLCRAAKSVIDSDTSNSSIKRCDIKREKIMRTRTCDYQDGENGDSELPQQQVNKYSSQDNFSLTDCCQKISISFCFCFLSLSHVHVWMHLSVTVTGVRVAGERPGGHEPLNLLCGGTMCTLRATSCLCVSHPALYLSIFPLRLQESASFCSSLSFALSQSLSTTINNLADLCRPPTDKYTSRSQRPRMLFYDIGQSTQSNG